MNLSIATIRALLCRPVDWLTPISFVLCPREKRALRGIRLPGFDIEYYLRQYPDVMNAGVDPLKHFLEFGWREGRNPNAFFDMAGYTSENADVAEAAVNPYIHFLRHGLIEGRSGWRSNNCRCRGVSDSVSLEKIEPLAPRRAERIL